MLVSPRLTLWDVLISPNFVFHLLNNFLYLTSMIQDKVDFGPTMTDLFLIGLWQRSCLKVWKSKEIKSTALPLFLDSFPSGPRVALPIIVCAVNETKLEIQYFDTAALYVHEHSSLTQDGSLRFVHVCMYVIFNPPHKYLGGGDLALSLTPFSDPRATVAMSMSREMPVV